ncbi:MAG: nitrilase-related carbon-nitrogen hydrolase, partial [Planctomycetota bacterium]
MRIALARFDATVGDIAGNARGIADVAVAEAVAGADCVVFPELALCGYPPRDLLQRAGFVAACERALEAMAADLAARGAGAAAVLVGAPQHAPAGSCAPFSNAVALLRGGRVEGRYLKRLLPDYDVFDEPRHFAPGSVPFVFACAGARVGVLVCEDLWRADDAVGPGRYACDPVADCVARGVHAIIALSASPFRFGKHERQAGILQAAAARIGGKVVSVNQVGANDDLVFDGASALVGAHGMIAELPRFAESVEALELDMPARAIELRDAQHDTFRALVAAIEGYLRKTGHARAIVGLSGGIDSAVVAALCVRALGSA